MIEEGKKETEPEAPEPSPPEPEVKAAKPAKQAVKVLLTRTTTKDTPKN